MLYFSPYAWAKTIYMRDAKDVEVGGFGIFEDPNDSSLITDFVLTKQKCSMASVKFDDDGIQDFYNEMIEKKLEPFQFARCWIHTHPGNCPNPSGVDEETFRRVFGDSDWAVMFILAKEGAEYCRVKYNMGPMTSIKIGTNIDYSKAFKCSDHKGWEQEYKNSVEAETFDNKFYYGQPNNFNGPLYQQNRKPSQPLYGQNFDDIDWDEEDMIVCDTKGNKITQGELEVMAEVYGITTDELLKMDLTDAMA